MDLAMIESQLERLTCDELRRPAIKSWAAFVRKESVGSETHTCDEPNSDLQAAPDEAVADGDAAPGRGYSAKAVRAHVDRWTSR